MATLPETLVFYSAVLPLVVLERGNLGLGMLVASSVSLGGTGIQSK
jgi:hypothetical protein